MTHETARDTPRKRRQTNTRQAILQKAREIIAASGPGALSMRGLAEQIDYSPSALYEYFASKDEIIGALCHEGFEQLGQFLGQVSTDLPPSEPLMAAGMAYIEFACQNPEHYRLMFGTYSVTFRSFSEASKNLTES